MENPSEALIEAIKELAAAITKMSAAQKECKKSGMSDIEIRDSILITIPEEDRPAFLMQWPMISMMFSAL